jgi:FixJ family two-component response regulator
MLVAMPITVLVVDDDAEFQALCVLLLRSCGYDVVGKAADAASAVDAAVSLRPSAILLDVNLPDRDGFWVAAALNDAGVKARILLTSSQPIDMSSHALAQYGAAAFIAKTDLATADLSDLLR